MLICIVVANQCSFVTVDYLQSSYKYNEKKKFITAGSLPKVVEGNELLLNICSRTVIATDLCKLKVLASFLLVELLMMPSLSTYSSWKVYAKSLIGLCKM